MARRIIPGLTLLVGLAAWLLLLWYTPIGFRLPLVGRYVEAFHFSRLAHGLPPSNIQAKRFSVISSALMHGQYTYSFTSSIGPGVTVGGAK